MTALHSFDEPFEVPDVFISMNGTETQGGTLKMLAKQLVWENCSREVCFNVQYDDIKRFGISSAHRDGLVQKKMFMSCKSTDGGEGCKLVSINFLTFEALLKVNDNVLRHINCDPEYWDEDVLGPDIVSKETSLSWKNSACRFSTELVKTNVTCVKFLGELLFAGIGDTIHVYTKDSNSNWSNLLLLQIFRGHNIYGIESNSQLFLIVYGGRNVSVLRCLQYPGVVRLQVVHSFLVHDWILDCLWLDYNQVALLSANNAVFRYDLSYGNSILLCKNVCTERCILYSGKLLHKSGSITVFAGTVFSSIIIWSDAGSDNPKNTDHLLEGHKGVIFSVVFCEKTNRIISTSDDRSVRVWEVDFDDRIAFDFKKCTIRLKFTLYGHCARVWKSKCTLDGKIVSVGEDSRVCLWNRDGTLGNQWSGHQNGEIWSLDISNDLELIATGGSDGGICIWPIRRAPTPHMLVFDNTNIRNAPKCVGFVGAGLPFMIDCLGKVFLYFDDKWIFCLEDSRFHNYCIHSVSPDRSLIALANISGCVLICRFINNALTKLMDFNVCDGRIFSLSWLSDYSFAVCATEGIFSIWDLNHNFLDSTKNIELSLPYSKERWVTSCAANDDFIVCGDRMGSLFLYSKKISKRDPIFTAKKIHESGITDIKFIHEKLVSTGRDGKYREFIIQDNKLIMVRCYKLKLDWAAAVMFTEKLQNILICFHEIYLVIWGVNERRPILKIDCGGGHRSWDCLINTISDHIYITYIKGKSVFYCSIPIQDVICLNILYGCHPKATNAACLLPSLHGNSNNDKLVLIGGEDTTLRLVALSKNTQTQLNVLHSHLSSVRTITCCKCDYQNLIYIATGGGRGQLVVWNVYQSDDRSMLEIIELASYLIMNPSKTKQSFASDEAEMRIMDLQVYQNCQKSIIIIAGCSDGVLRLFNYDTIDRTISLLQNLDGGRCFLKTILIDLSNDSMLISTNTSGVLSFYKLKGQELVEPTGNENSYCLSDSGINSCDCKYVKNHLVVCAAGDDACVNMVIFALNDNEWETIHHWKNSSAHTCQISGLKMVDDLLFTAGLDNLFSVFRWKLSSSNFHASIIAQTRLSIPDIHGTLVWEKEDNSYVIYVYGLGTQLLKFVVDVP